MPAVVVYWLDAHADANGWTDITELDLEPRRIQSCGFLLDPVKPDHVSLAQSVDGPNVDQVIHIPRVNVIRIRPLQ